jgi:hypothetical protein
MLKKTILIAAISLCTASGFAACPPANHKLGFDIESYTTVHNDWAGIAPLSGFGISSDAEKAGENTGNFCQYTDTYYPSFKDAKKDYSAQVAKNLNNLIARKQSIFENVTQVQSVICQAHPTTDPLGNPSTAFKCNIQYYINK